MTYYQTNEFFCQSNRFIPDCGPSRAADNIDSKLDEDD
jgi:hypothetical protein